MAQSPSSHDQPIDRGWSWLVCLSGSVIRFLLNGFWTSIGLFFIHWERDFDTNASSVAIIGSIIMCQWFMGPFVTALSHTFTHRTITFISGLLITMSFIAGSQLATEIWHLYLVSTIAVIGLGCAWHISVVHVTYYFKDKLGVAVSFVTGFAASGTLVLPILLQMSLEYFGWRGAMLLLAAIMCNISAVSLLLRPVIPSAKYANSEAALEPAKTNTSRSARFKQTISKCGTIFHLDLFYKSLPFWVTCFLGLTNGLAFSPMFVYIAPHAVQLNIPEFQASLLIVVMGLCSLTTRFSSGIIVDKQILSSWKFYSLCLAICGTSCFLFPFHTSYLYLMMLSAVFGLSDGGIESLYVLVFVDLVGKENTSASFAWGNTMWAVGGVISIYFGGFLYDSAGSYNPVFYTAGFILMCASALTLSTKQIQNLQGKLQKQGGCLFGCNTTKDDDYEIDKFMKSKYELVTV